MKRNVVRAVLLYVCVFFYAGIAAIPSVAASDPLTAAISCENCAQWNRAHAPVHIHGDTYYVGTEELSSILIKTPEGLVLIDGDLPQSAPLIEQNIRALGFRVEDIKLILVSHEHFDHAGGIAALQRDSGAKVMCGVACVRALRSGRPTPEDPQFPSEPFPRVGAAEAVTDGDTLTVGGLKITAHSTPGHTPGSTSWTWLSCGQDGCFNVVYADSLKAISNPSYRFSGDSHHDDVTGRFRASIAKISKLPCDILLTPHPAVSGFWERIAARKSEMDLYPFRSSNACEAYAAAALKNLEDRVAQEHSRKLP